jgi:exonuclease SbcD
MFKWILNRETIDKSKVNILLTHQFFMWDGKTPLESDSESISLNSVGTIDAIDVNLLDDFDYVAGGHIHRPQKIKRDTIRYSGSPLKYSFSEVSDNKSVVIIDTNDINNLEFISLKPLRELRCIRGSFDEVMKMDISDDIIRVELTDENNFLSPMEEIRKRFKNAISLVFVNKYKESDDNSYFSCLNDSPYFLFKSFFKEQNGRELNDDEDSYISDLIKSIEED